MELRHLRYFVAVAEERSFTRAAERLHVAQPPLSRQIQQLEAELGASLIKRGTRPWSLTDAGQLVYEQALQTLEKFDAIPQVLRRFQDAKRSRIGIGFVASTLYGYLPEVIRSYRAARPDVDMNLLELTTFEQAAALKEGRIDVGFGRLPMQDPALRHQLLRNEPIVAAVPVGHRLAESDKPLHLSDLEGETVIVYPKHPRPSYADRVLSLIHAAGVKPLGFMEIKDCGIDIQWKSGARHAKGATITLKEPRGDLQIIFEPQYEFFMKGLGYGHPTWGHGLNHGELAVEREDFVLADVDVRNPQNLHVQALSKVIYRPSSGAEQIGRGVLEQLALGPHEPSGFTQMLDFAP